jgi:TOTE conflict system, Archaeo-Eukaryotic Primase domain
MQMSDEQVRRFASLVVGRRDDYALQQEDGRYARAGQPLTYEALRLHLAGGHTIGTYVIDERERCRFAVLDADDMSGLLQLLEVQKCLAGEGIASYTELSRRGLHLWVLLARLVSPRLLRQWLLPYCPEGVEFYPKQDDLGVDRRYGSLVRLPLGVHRRSGRRYPFVSLVDGHLVPVARSVSASLTWLASVQRSPVPDLPTSGEPDQVPGAHPTHMLVKKEAARNDLFPSSATVYTWCLSQEPARVIGRYIKLDQRGMGCCPFGEHHSDGRDSRPSFQVRPLRPGSVNCWYCYAWQRGGSVFGFLCFWHLFYTLYR